MRKVFVLGLDSLPPKVLYEGYGEGLDFIREMTKESANYLMRSCYPPITIPAWMSMFTGKTPGELGIYGFRHRRPGSFESYVINSSYIKEKAIWDELPNVRTGLFGVPPTYPPKPINGFMVTDFNTPSKEKPYTFPPWLKKEISSMGLDPIFDIVYRTEDKESGYRDLMNMVDNHLKIMDYLVKKRWDLFIYVEIGIDRAHHMFWSYFDKSHPKYEYHEKYSNAIPEVYRKVDSWFSKINERLPKDTIYIIVSDHGMKSVKGSFVINQWLQEKGFLKLKRCNRAKRNATEGKGWCGDVIDLNEELIDWEETQAWAWGGYYSRVFINLQGREKRGIVRKEDVEGLLKDLKKEVEKIKGPSGEAWENFAFKPEEIYPEVKGDPPDLMVYLDNLNWRPIGSVGYDSLYQEKNDKGPDDSIHDWYGVFSVYDPEGTIEKGNKGVININEIKDFLKEIILSR
ncbi:MAG: alkaline phosphatase family protein [Caldisphaeraceae archaeon]|nr:alkaline phosphatase family protein [Caldisphaeraceae archaeon]